MFALVGMERGKCSAMPTRLSRIRNWDELAERANYSTKELANQCKISVRQLERFFHEAKGESPHQWLNDLRQRRALGLVGESSTMKEVAAQLGYKSLAHFSREFKRAHGCSPSQFGLPPAMPSPAVMSHLDNHVAFRQPCRI